MFRPAASQLLVQSLSRASVLPLQLHSHLGTHPWSKLYQDVVVRLGREITTFCSEVQKLISWWKTDLPSPQAHTDIDKLVGQCHVAFDKIDQLVPVSGPGQGEREGDYRDDGFGQYAIPDDDDLQRNLEYISAYINAVARTFHVMTDTFRIAETIRDDQLVLRPRKLTH
jgi:hypothetical protein